MTALVTGGAGFIGSNLVRRLLREKVDRVVVVDKLTYAGHRANLDDLPSDRFVFVKADIADADAISRTLSSHRPSVIFNLAAETHVDRSIDGPEAFVQTNLVGAFRLLEAARAYQETLPPSERERLRFVQVSTDEVYGSLGPTGFFTETTPYEPNSPYSASKAGADHLAHAYFSTYGFPVVITNCSNNFGPYQFPEKLVPLMVLNALEGKPLPIYGDGGNVRDWLFVEDHIEALVIAAEKGRPGEKYNIGASGEHTNLDIVDALCDALETVVPAGSNPALSAKGVGHYRDLKTFVPDRPGHDRRYAIDASKFRNETGWRPAHSFDAGLRATVEWYVKNRAWCDDVQRGQYDRQRLGIQRNEIK